MKTIALLAAFAVSTNGVIQLRPEGDWARVMRLKPGTTIRVHTRDGVAKETQVGLVRDDRLVVLNLGGLPKGARNALLDLAQDRPGFVGVLPKFKYGKLDVDGGSIFFDGTRVADVSAVIVDIPRDQIAEIQRPPRDSIVGGLLGAAGGLVAGIFSAAYFAFKQCGDSCGDETALIWGSLVGLPLGGGLLGAKALKSKNWSTLYRAG